MPVLLQILLALFGQELGGFMFAKLGGPKIDIGEPFIDPRPTILPNQEIKPFLAGVPSGGTISYDSLSSNLVSYGDYLNRYYIHIPIYNKQKSGFPIGTAREVYAKLIFSDLEGVSIGGEFDGRWEKSAQPTSPQDFESLRFIDIPAEDNQILDIATQDIRGGSWYVWNNSSYPNFKYPSNKLKEDGFVFSLRLNGTNVSKKTIRYKFFYSGQEKKPIFTKISA